MLHRELPPVADGRLPGDPGRPEPATTARLFLALWPTADEQLRLARHLRDWSWRQGTAVVRPERWHLTLHFIGALERRHIAELSAGLQVAMTPFELSLTDAEIWPQGLAVLRASASPDALMQLHARLGEALQALGLPVDRRRFRPHVTLARRATASITPARPPQQSWRVSSYLLVESLTASGGGYQVLRSYH